MKIVRYIDENHAEYDPIACYFAICGTIHTLMKQHHCHRCFDANGDWDTCDKDCITLDCDVITTYVILNPIVLKK